MEQSKPQQHYIQQSKVDNTQANPKQNRNAIERGRNTVASEEPSANERVARCPMMSANSLRQHCR